MAMAGTVAGGWSGPGVKGFRNIFGPPARTERYQGFLELPEGEARTRDLMDRLARRMREPYSWPHGDGRGASDNPDLPAGYVYLAQLVAHDLSFLSSTLPSVDDPLVGHRNLRAIALNLDTVYGGGPLDKPFAYARSGRGTPRHLLRLAPAPGRPERIRRRDYDNDDAFQAALDAHRGELEAWEGLRRGARDIARVSCPHLNDPAGSRSDALTDPLIADPRNDDNAILSQTLVLFHMLHNSVCERLVGKPVSDAGGRTFKASDRGLFRAARGVVTRVYHDVLRRDLMPRLLNDKVLTRYQNGPDAFIDRSAEAAMPVEFAHAAFRVGHAMVSPAYRFNARARFGLRDVLLTNSTDLPSSMPIAGSWLIDWSHFYELGGARPNLAQRIAPHLHAIFYDDTMFGEGEGRDAVPSLAHHDLLRCASRHIRSLRSLIAHVPNDLCRASPVLSSADFRRQVIDAWLGNGDGFAEDERQQIAEDPPLSLFLYLEAAVEEEGLRLGTLGSLIVAEVIYRAMENAEEDAASGEMAGTVFGGETPRTMPDVLRFLASHYDLARSGFVGSETSN